MKRAWDGVGVARVCQGEGVDASVTGWSVNWVGTLMVIGIAAGGGLSLFERRMRKRDSVCSGTVEGDFGGRVPPGNEK